MAERVKFFKRDANGDSIHLWAGPFGLHYYKPKPWKAQWDFSSKDGWDWLKGLFGFAK